MGWATFGGAYVATEKRNELGQLVPFGWIHFTSHEPGSISDAVYWSYRLPKYFGFDENLGL